MVFGQNPLLTSDASAVSENSSLTLTCFLPRAVTPVSWTKNSDISTTVRTGFLSGNCISNPSPLPQGFSYTCVNTTVFTLTLLGVNRTQDGDRWQCSANINNPSLSDHSNVVTLTVQVPISSVSFANPPTSNTIDVVENSTHAFTCQTTGGIPAATVTWFKASGTSETAITSGVEPSQTISSDKTITVTSTLTYTARRGDSGSKVFCRASNVQGEVKKSAREILLNILYPPLSGPVIQGFTGTEGYKMIRNSSTQQQLICSVTGGNPLSQLLWNCYNGNQAQSAQDDTVTRTVTWTAGLNVDSVCRCNATHTSSSWSREASVAVTVLYPPSDPQCTVGLDTVTSGTIRVIQGRTFNIACNSDAKPSAQYTWTLPDGGRVPNPTLSVPNVQTMSTYSLSVWNTMGPSRGDSINGTANTAFNLDILFPPSTPVSYYVNGASHTLISTSPLKVIQGTSFSVTCNSTGNPQPSCNWSGASQTWYITAVKNISNTCTARNSLNPTGFQSEPKESQSELDVTVLTPPGVITCTVGTSTFTSGPVYVIRGSIFSVSCESTSFPYPYKYTWTLPNGTTQPGSTLTVQNIQSVNRNQYRIEVNNSMVPTVGTGIDGTNSTELDVHLLYPPTVQAGIHVQGNSSTTVVNDSYISMVENDTFSLDFDVVNGNPNNTAFRWTRKSANTVITESRPLLFNSIRRGAADMYTFTAYTLMRPTGYNHQNGEAVRQVYVNVKYPAEVISFYGNNVMDKTTIIADMGDDLHLVCQIDSNPESTIKMLLDGKNLIGDTSSDRQLEFHKSNTSCEYDMGEYTCMAQNELNTAAVMRRLHYLVKCMPRLSPFVPNTPNVTGRLHMPGIIPLSVIAYPEPTFLWQKLIASSWQTITNASRVYIVTSTDRLQSSITIANVTQDDFGTYRAIVNNSEGGVTIDLFFQSSAKPEPVTGLEYQQHTLTTDSVVVTWRPGFDGGLPQTFYVLLKKKTDTVWSSEIVTSENNITLNNLHPGNDYLVKVFAGNAIGNSTESLAITFTTQKHDSVSSPVAGIAGGVVGGALGLLAAIIALILFGRKYRITCAFIVDRKHDRCSTYETPRSRLDMSDHLYSGVQSQQTEDDTAQGKVHYENTTIINEDTYEPLRATGATDRLSHVYDPLKSNPIVLDSTIMQLEMKGQAQSVYMNMVLK